MPSNFCFVIEGLLAGMERPGTHAPLREDLAFLKERLVGAIVSLTEVPLDRALVEEFGFVYHHLPVDDFCPPSLAQIEEFAKVLDEAQARGTPLVVHCGAGRGRTGTVLACALVRRGAQAEDAIVRLRQVRPYSIETPEQEDLVRAYARHLQRGLHGA